MANYMLPISMKSQFNGGALKSGVLKNGATYLDIPNGAIATNSYTLETDYGYGASVADPNVFVFGRPAALTDKAYVADLSMVPEATDANGNIYRLGADTTNLTLKGATKVPARFRELFMEDTLELGDTNFASTPTVGQFAVLTVGATTLTPATVKPGTGFTVKVLRKLQLNSGLQKSGDRYLCVVVQL